MSSSSPGNLNKGNEGSRDASVHASGLSHTRRFLFVTAAATYLDSFTVVLPSPVGVYMREFFFLFFFFFLVYMCCSSVAISAASFVTPSKMRAFIILLFYYFTILLSPPPQLLLLSLALRTCVRLFFYYIY